VQIPCELVVSRCDPAPVLQVRECSLDHIASLVGGLVERRDILSGRIGFDNRGATPCGKECTKLVAVVSGVGQDQRGRRQLFDETPGRLDIALLAGGEFEGDQMARRVGDGMDFGCPAAAVASDCLLLGPPFPPAAQRCVLAVVLSILCDPGPPGSTSASSIVCQIPPPTIG
jgi:hypothetical protein